MSEKVNTAISISNLSKCYQIGQQKDGSLRGTISGLFKSGNSNHEEFWALKDINLEVKVGEIVGIIGKNGAGKSTLLKILSQITQPTTGRIIIEGRVASLLEVGTGFHPELTGRENIYLNGTILGMTRKEVTEKFEEIVAFSGIEKFIDTPVKRYSSGMYVRLAFSVAAHLEPEILIIDEVLAVGDAEFQKKCLGKMKDVANKGRTVIFVSHDLAAVKKLCNTGVLLRDGKIINQGDVTDILSEYVSSFSKSSKYISSKITQENEVSFQEICLLGHLENELTSFTCNDEISIRFKFNINAENHKYLLFVIVKDHLGSPVFSAEKPIDNGVETLIISKNFLTRGNYFIHTFIHIPMIKQIDAVEEVCHFTVTDSTSDLSIHGNYNYGNVFGRFTWKSTN